MIDELDLKIIKFLMEDCRGNLSEFSKKNDIPYTTAYLRLGKLIESGKIQASAVITEEIFKQFNFPITTIIARLNPKTKKDEIANISEEVNKKYFSDIILCSVDSEKIIFFVIVKSLERIINIIDDLKLQKKIELVETKDATLIKGFRAISFEHLS